jgi:hypothetical protein
MVGGLEDGFYFSIQLGMSLSQLTFTPSFFRGVGIPPASLDGLYWKLENPVNSWMIEGYSHDETEISLSGFVF